MGKWLHLAVGIVVGLGLFVVVPSALAVDELMLLDGSRLSGDLDDAGITLMTPRGPVPVTRDRVWRLVLDSGATGDIVNLRNGTRLSGWVDRPRYSLRLPGGETRTLARQDIGVIKLGPPSAAADVRRVDVVVLANGDHVAGDLATDDFELVMPSGAQHFRRADVWRLWLDSVSGDGIQLMNGDIVKGIANHTGYQVRTASGQTLAFARGEMKEIFLRVPERPRPAAAAPAAVVVVAPAPPPPPTVAPAAVPPAVRAVLRDLHFEFDRWDLTPDARRNLEEVASALKSFPSLGLLIEGHADERGTAEYNLALGSRRAQAAKDYLVSLGIDAGRLDTISYGEERPLDSAHNEVAWALNRRAHFAVKAQ
jgi:peptidoglycan-associated lipoprotein